MKLITSAYPNKHRAIEVLQDLGDLDLDWGVPLDEVAAALTVHRNGKVRVHRSHEAASAGAVIGGLTGFVAGLLFFAPGVGTAIGAVTGGAIGSAADPTPLDGIDKDYLKALGSNLSKDSSALVVLISDAAADAAMASIRAYDDGVVTAAVIDAATEQAIRDRYQASLS